MPIYRYDIDICDPIIGDIDIDIGTGILLLQRFLAY